MKVKALKIENVSKQYKLGQVGTGTLSDDLKRWWYKMRGKEDPFLQIGQENDREVSGGDYVMALRDINFELDQGEVVGIIGRNGAGKSTLLKLLSQVTTPTTGSIKVKGRIAALLEVGTGFHPELTGRENIFLNGAILGMTKKEIASKLDEIVAFSGVAKYLDTPVKRYSSGMKVRLGFAVAAHLEPEILVVDEVLAVGDAEFQKKSIGKMQDVAETGRTVLFVSHNMNSIRNLCQRVIVLDKGQVVFDGAVDAGINYYLNENMPSSEDICALQKFDLDQNSYVKEVRFGKENGEIEYSESQIEFYFNLYFKELLIDVFLGIIIEDENGNNLIISSSDELENNVLREVRLIGDVNLKFSIPGKILKPGVYFLTFSLRGITGSPFHKVERAIKFEVVDTFTYKGLKNRYRSSALISPECKYSVL